MVCAVALGAEAQVKSNSDLKYHNIVNINAAPINGYLEHLPPGYHSNPNKKYPMIVFLHGKGEKGDGKSQVYRAAKLGPSKEIERGNGKLCFTVNGVEECFIVISPQTSQGWSSNQQKAFWQYILNGPKNYRYDPERIFLTGLSLGGNGVWRWAQSGDPLASKLSAIAPVCGWGNANTACDFAQEEISVWGFHGTADNTVNYDWGKSVYDALVQCNNPGNKEWKWSPIEGKAHAIWNIVYDPSHDNYNPNVYEWFLTQRKSQGSGSSNQSPNVSISGPNSITLPTNQAVFTANASDPDGSIKSYAWSKISGPSVSMSNTNQAKMTANSLVAGTYEFKVVVTDNDGAKSSSKATLVVNAEPQPNDPPTVTAGPDITMDEGSDAYISGSGNDKDGWITDFTWTKVSGPAATLRDQDKANLRVIGPQAGTYVFQLKVTDNDGASSTDRMTLTVGQSTGSGGDFVVRAGDDFSVDVSAGTISTVARWDDIPDAYVTDITWVKVSGPAVNITQGDKARIIAEGINVGVYDFKVTVTDSKGRKGSDNVLVTVTGDDSGSGTGDDPAPPPTGDFPVDAGDDFEWDASKGDFNILARWDLPNTYVTGIKWVKVSGPAATLKQTNKAKLLVSNPATGSYTFRVTVTDSENREGVDEINVVVINGDGSSGSTGSGISVDAGDDFTWDATKGDFNVLARWDIPDAYITKIKWDKVSGNWIKMQDTDKAKMWLLDPKPGTYTFKVTITDSKERTASDRITVTVVDGITSSMSATDDLPEEITGTRTIVKNFITSESQISLISDAAENLQVQVININGAALKTSEFSGELNTGSLGSGMYIYQIFNEDGFVIQKGRIIKN